MRYLTFLTFGEKKKKKRGNEQRNFGNLKIPTVTLQATGHLSLKEIILGAVFVSFPKKFTFLNRSRECSLLINVNVNDTQL